MKLNKIFLSLCFMVICAIGFAQTASDYRKAAEQGDASAQFNMGICYYYGYGVMKDYSLSVYWWKKAAEQGNTEAQCNLGACYQEGYGVTKSHSQAVFWYRKAAEQGNALAQYNLARCYCIGEGVATDYSQAVYWCRKAAEQGIVSAQTLLCNLYYDGKGVEEDYSQAAYWSKKAAEQGSAVAQYILGLCYYHGDGMAQDFSKAAYYFRKAAEQDDADAQYHLGSCYYAGNGVVQDYSQAVYWCKKAAEQGVTAAQYLLGECYYYGRGVNKDDDLAVEWLKKVKDNPVYLYLANNLLDKLLNGESVTAAINNHDYVDLGLSVLWATCNVGATNPEEYGDYFAWGETTTKNSFDWDNYQFCTTYYKYSKYVSNNEYGVIDNKINLEPTDDAVCVNWGDSWRMPTLDEINELIEKCDWTWTNIKGHNGYKVVSKLNGNSIFLPAAGHKNGSTLYSDGVYGNYWSSTLYLDDSKYACHFYFSSGGVDSFFYGRDTGTSIRPVKEKDIVLSTAGYNNSNTFSPSEKVFSSTEVDIAPKFNGGDMGEFTKWVNQNVIYPDVAKQYDIKGRVITKFTIHSNGQISDIQILKGVDSSLDKEAINVLKKAPALTPARKDGKNVAISYMLPIDFGR